MSVNQDELDSLFQEAEHTKDLPLAPKLWDRLDNKLEIDKQKLRSAKYKRFSIISTAACIALLIGVFFHAASHKQNPKEFVIESLYDSFHETGVYKVEDIDFLSKKRIDFLSNNHVDCFLVDFSCDKLVRC